MKLYINYQISKPHMSKFMTWEAINIRRFNTNDLKDKKPPE